MIDMILLAVMHAATVAVVCCLISESNLAAPLRKALDFDILYCPICLGFWMALPCFFWGPLHYFLVVAISNGWMLLILCLYEALDRASEAELNDKEEST